MPTVKSRKAQPKVADLAAHPISEVKWVPLDKTEANDYNPNKVAPNELRLLYLSIKNDGYTQPVVTFYDPERDRYVIVDGFHRRHVMLTYKDIRESTGGLLPVVVIDKPLNDRMASTVRHNRARGKHGVGAMANIVFGMLDNGWSDEEVASQLGMETDELVRLKYVTGFAKLFEDTQYRRAWETKRQIRIRRDYREAMALADGKCLNCQAPVEDQPFCPPCAKKLNGTQQEAAIASARKRVQPE